ncbi:MAG: F0F1 ATP synthase subunit A [Bacteroidales bacterium]
MHGIFKKNIWSLVLLLFFFAIAPKVFAQETTKIGEDALKSTNSELDQEAFDAGNMILEHVTDRHAWHICTIGKRDIEIPLPIILIYQGNLSVFSSARFDKDGRYENFQLRSQEPYKGKVVAWTQQKGVSPLKEENSISSVVGQDYAVIDPNLPIDLSITKNVFGLFISSILLFIVFLMVAQNYKKRGVAAPKGIAAIVEPIYLFIQNDVVYGNMGKKHGDRFIPYMETLFFFILFANLLGLVPIFPFGANLMGNIAVTLCLAAFTFIITMCCSSKTYWRDVFNMPGVPWWMKFPIPLVPLIEIIEVFTKPLVLMIRLFANIVAGHIVILGFVFLIFIFGELSVVLGYVVSPVSIIFGLFIDALELLVSFIQAYIFTMLSSIYVAGALGYEPVREKKQI